MVSPLFGLSRWVAGHGIRSFGLEEEGQEELWGGKVATQRSDTAGFAFCMKGRINSEPNDSHSLWSKGRYSFSSLVQRQALRPLTVFTVGLCFQNEKSSVGGRVLVTAKQCAGLMILFICTTFIKPKERGFLLLFVLFRNSQKSTSIKKKCTFCLFDTFFSNWSPFVQDPLAPCTSPLPPKLPSCWHSFPERFVSQDPSYRTNWCQTTR